MNAYKSVSTPMGILRIASDGTYITNLFLKEEHLHEFMEKNQVQENSEDPLLNEAEKQLNEYFAGTRKDFSLPLKQKGTAFQEKVWQALTEIPYGTSCTYQAIAVKTGNPKAVRAVGQANRKNNLPIIVPCHRVIGANGRMTGYAGANVHLKQVLLDLEKIPYKM
ncbi:methylated-DNA--[protein]-cysteine S-methyltransferase [Metabacillus sp. SLBN-84]